MTVDLNELKSKQSGTTRKRSNRDTERYSATVQQAQAESVSAIDSTAIALSTKASNSLQALDLKLGAFENQYADAAVQRISEVPTRINVLIAQKLQEVTQPDPLSVLVDGIDCWEIPEFGFPAIAPASAQGCLPAF